MEANNSLDALQSALLGPSFDVNSEEKLTVKAEDVQNGGIDYSKHFFEPRVGETYLLKFLPNPGGDLITHRSVYKHLPDPDRKGKTFHYISSGNAKTCKALELFFELNALKKEGDAVAKAKIDKYLTRTNQGCCKVQILGSPKKDEIGQIRLFVFATFGPNATVANLISQKLNPTKEQIEQGYEREDIFNIFSSSVLSLVCEEAVYDGIKGRDFTKSGWAPKPKGAIAIKETGETRQFVASDLVDGKLSEEAKPWFAEFIKQFNNPDCDVYKWFSYKSPDDERLADDKETREYIKSTFDKVSEIVEVIRNKSLAEIANYGRKSKDDKDVNDDSKKNVLAESIPDELKDIKGAETETTETKSTASDDDEVDAILNE